MAESPLDGTDNEVFTTSFSNPNYRLNDADALNSNVCTDYFDNHLYENMDFPISENSPSSKGRKRYANMDLSAMGIDLQTELLQATQGASPEGFSFRSPDSADSAVTSPDDQNAILEVEHTEPDTEGSNSYASGNPKGFLGYYASLELSAKAREEEVEEEDPEEEKKPLLKQNTSQNKPNGFDIKTTDINSPDSNDSGIQADVQPGRRHVQGPINNDIYAVVDKKFKKRSKDKDENKENKDNSEYQSDDNEEVIVADLLPPGWERCEDEDGAYYWHIKSGTIQREAPAPLPASYRQEKKSTPSEASSGSVSSLPDTSNHNANTDQDHLQEFEGHAFKYATESLKSMAKREDEKEKITDTEQRIRFAVRSLGWVRIAEEDLTPERSSKAVNKCIVDLSLGRNDINDVVGRWGDGKDLYMDLDSETLTLIDPQDMSILNIQPIPSIRVWGVGRDNGRDFAYVARDRLTRKHMCHVFRCDTPARQIANTLRDICKKILVQRSVQHNMQTPTNGTHKVPISRPNNLPNLDKAGDQPNGQKLTFQNLYKNASFPTPMEEPKKVLRCHYLGTAQVTQATGVDVLNSATEKVYAKVPPEKWVFVSVAVAPSTITITEHANPDNVLAECRVRFLSFMGIAMKNVKLCTFITHTAQNHFVAHVFHCEPSAGALCKTIEAACKLRYQKCLDAHPQTPEMKKQAYPQQGKPEPADGADKQKAGVAAALKAGVQNVFGKFKSTKKHSKKPS